MSATRTADRARSSWLLRLLPVATLAVTLALLLVAISPGEIGNALRGFNFLVLPLAIVLARLYFGVQAIRAQLLLRNVGVRLGFWDAQLVTMASQVVALLPFGQYARAVFASRVTGAPVGTAASTVLVQEMTYALALLALAVPGSFAHPGVAGTVLVSLGGTVAVISVLAVPALYRSVRRLLGSAPLLSRLIGPLDQMHAGTATLLLSPGATLGIAIAFVYSAMYVTLLWLITDGVQPGALSWPKAAFVCAISHLAGAATTLPGGLGAYEAGTIALMVSVGVKPGVAVAATILFTLADRGIGTLLGVGPYFILERRPRKGAHLS